MACLVGQCYSSGFIHISKTNKHPLRVKMGSKAKSSDFFSMLDWRYLGHPGRDVQQQLTCESGIQEEEVQAKINPNL